MSNAALLSCDITGIPLERSSIEEVRDKLAEIITTWNVQKKYKEYVTHKDTEGNCQDFVEDVLFKLGIDSSKVFSGVLGDFLKEMREKGTCEMKFKMTPDFFRKFCFNSNSSLSPSSNSKNNDYENENNNFLPPLPPPAVSSSASPRARYSPKIDIYVRDGSLSSSTNSSNNNSSSSSSGTSFVPSVSSSFSSLPSNSSALPAPINPNPMVLSPPPSPPGLFHSSLLVRIFETHRELDLFVKSLLRVDIHFGLNYSQEWILLKSFDRAFWLRYLRSKENEKYAPLSVSESIKIDQSANTDGEESKGHHDDYRDDYFNRHNRNEGDFHGDDEGNLFEEVDIGNGELPEQDPKQMRHHPSINNSPRKPKIRFSPSNSLSTSLSTGCPFSSPIDSK